MRIKATFSSSSIAEVLKTKVKQIEEAIITELFAVGITCVAEAVSKGSYTNRTYNLRSSIGFVVVKNGSVVMVGGFESSGSGSDGAAKGAAFATSLASLHPVGYGLILVAGENYASYVESRGFNVLSSAHSLGKLEFNTAVKTIKAKVKSFK